MSYLNDVFARAGIRQWGVGSLGDVIPGASAYRYVAFCLPYNKAAIQGLPDEIEMDRCKAELAAISKRVYADIAKDLVGFHCSHFEEMDEVFDLRGHGVSQKVLAHLAGLGWIGRSSLLITEQYGPRVRLGTLFTTGPIEPVARAYNGSCGTCTACAEACPNRAITPNGYDVVRCREIVIDECGQPKAFCGLCMQA
jgi:epoxyqueuosine reductase QueG